MPINIPPSPSAGDAPDYAQRLREVRELTNSKKPTRRRRRARSVSAEDQQSPKEKAAASRRQREDVATSPANNSTGAGRPSNADASNIANSQAAARAIQQRVDKFDAARLVRFPRRKEPQLVQTPVEGVSFPRVMAACAIVSTAVSLVVSFASQGILSPVATSLIAASGSLSSL